MPAHPEQITAASNIRAVFQEGNLRYALLFAYCQAGKTGAFQELIRQMLLEGDINRAYILCGSNETDLRSQAHADTIAANPEAYAAGDIQVFFRQDFKGASMDITRALIVVDESHMDQTQGQELDEFLWRHGISMDGEPRTLNEKDAYIVSVDATPYSELSAMKHKESHAKHVEELAAGPGYFGIAAYYYGGLIKPAYDIAAKRAEFKQMIVERGNKYALMRLSSGKHAAAQETAATAAYRQVGGQVVYYTAEKTEIAITAVQKAELGLSLCLEDAPAVPTLVIIRGRLRAGKVVPKQHVSFVWEGAKMSKTDALVQGLVGRMCGYEFGAEKPLIFVPQGALNERSGKVLIASELGRVILGSSLALPTMATNLKKGRIADKAPNGTTQCPPLRLTWDFDEDDWTATYDPDERNDLWRQRCHDLLMRNLDEVRDNRHLSAAQKTEILEQIVVMDPQLASVRHLQGTAHHAGTANSWFKQCYAAYESGTTSSVSAGSKLINFAITYRGYKEPHANQRHLYVIFYTKATSGAAPGILSVDLKSRYPKTNGKSVFSIHDYHVDKPLVAAGVVGFDECAIKTPALLQSALSKYLQMWRDSGLTVSRCIQSTKERFTLSSRAFHYKTPKQNDVEKICADLGAQFGVKIKVTFARCAATTFNVKKIEW
jgi:hypothetical protein